MKIKTFNDTEVKSNVLIVRVFDDHVSFRISQNGEILCPDINLDKRKVRKLVKILNEFLGD